MGLLLQLFSHQDRHVLVAKGFWCSRKYTPTLRLAISLNSKFCTFFNGTSKQKWLLERDEHANALVVAPHAAEHEAHLLEVGVDRKAQRRGHARVPRPAAPQQHDVRRHERGAPPRLRPTDRHLARARERGKVRRPVRGRVVHLELQVGGEGGHADLVPAHVVALVGAVCKDGVDPAIPVDGVDRRHVELAVPARGLLPGLERGLVAVEGLLLLGLATSTSYLFLN